jgi:hypothetical protein
MSEPTTMRRPAPSQSAVAAPVREWLAVDIGDGESLSAADLLRLLDRMRQKLSRHLVGSPGAFIGYDSLTVPRGPLAGPGRVIVEARLRAWSQKLHDVEYLAVSVPFGAERPTANDPPLLRGTGRTLHVEC